MDIIKKLKPVGTVQKIIFWTIIFFIAYTIVGFFILPPIIKIIAVNKIEENLNRKVSIDKITLNPYALSLGINGLSVKEKDKAGDFISFKSLYVNIQSSSIFKFAPVVREVRLDTPYLRVVRDSDGGFNFSDLIKTFTREKTSHFPLHFSLNNLQIFNGYADIQDKQMDKNHTLREFNLSIPFISNMRNSVHIFVEPHFSLDFNDSQISSSGKAIPFHTSRDTTIGFSVKGLDISKYFEYVPIKSNLIVSSGNVDADVAITFISTKDKRIELAISGYIELKQLIASDTQNNPLLNVDQGRIVFAPSNLLEGNIHLKSIMIKSPQLTINRFKDGTLNIYNLVTLASTKDVTKSTPTTKIIQPGKLTIEELNVENSVILLSDFYQSQENRSMEKSDFLTMPNLSIKNIDFDMAKSNVVIEKILTQKGTLNVQRLINRDLNINMFTGNNNQVVQENNSPVAKAEHPFLVTVNNISVNGFNIHCKDIVDNQTDDILLSQINIMCENISTIENSKAKLDFSCKINETTDVKVNGEACIFPTSTNMNLDVNALNLPLFQPFINDIIGDKFDFAISSGKVSTDGNISASYSGSQELIASFKGNASIDKFLLSNGEESEKLIELSQISVQGIDANVSPISANIEHILIKDFDCLASMDADGQINFQKILITKENENSLDNNITSKEEEEEEEAEGSEETIQNSEKEYSFNSIPINIRKISLENGNLSFIDHSINPKFSMSISDVSGSINRISSQGSEPTEIVINAKIDGSIPVDISGKADLLKKELFIDMNVQLDDLDLSPFSPYTGKFIGYNVKKGKLNLDLAYLIKNMSLDADVNLLVDQFELGDKVDSKDAVKAPIKLGIALLKNKKGEIALKLPVTGQLDDPEFKLRGIILKTILNVLVKAATSPFSFIASAFRGGEDLNYLEFSAGSSLLTDTNKSKLDTIIKALDERPGIDLEIVGFVDTKKDKEMLVLNEFDKKIKYQKYIKVVNIGKDATAVDDINIALEEYEKYLKKAFKANNKAKEINVKISSKDENYLDKMKTSIKESIKITEADLRLLVKNRMQSVKTYILEGGKIVAERLFLVETGKLNPEKINKLKDSRVELSLK
jgi:hypothetical protein